MRARDVVGKTVARVVQERTYVDKETLVYNVKSIEFTDGTVLYFSVAELPGDYAVEGGVVKKPKRNKVELKATPCRNCGERPTVERSHDEDYDYVLRHAMPTLCPTMFHLLSYQNTPEACIKDWNEHNKRDL